MALLGAFCFALLLMIVTVVAMPALALVEPPSSGRPDPNQPSAATPAPTASLSGRDADWVPQLGKATSPYDMNALRNFDAGSHR